VAPASASTSVARFATNAIVIRDDDAAIQRLQSGFDPGTVILADGEAKANRGDSRVRTTARTGNKWTAEVQSSTDGWLVFAETFFPGMRVKVDGVDKPLLRADVTFSAVAVPAGRHLVEKTYRPTAPLIGLLASIATALALAFWRVNQ